MLILTFFKGGQQVHDCIKVFVQTEHNIITVTHKDCTTTDFVLSALSSFEVIM